MKKIKLYGDLARFKSNSLNAEIDIPVGFLGNDKPDKFAIDWVLDVKSPSEALRAIEANRPGFLAATKQGDYAVLLIADNPDLTRRVLIDNAHDPWADEIMMVVPVPKGNTGIEEAVFAAIASAAVAAGASVAVAFFIADVAILLIQIGIAMAVAAIANVITGDKKSVTAPQTEKYDSKPSFISNGAVNVSRPGHPYPILVGRVRDAGSMVLSSNYYVEDIPV